MKLPGRLPCACIALVFCLIHGALAVASTPVADGHTTASAPAPEGTPNPRSGPFESLRDLGISLRLVVANDWNASLRGGERTGMTNGGGANGGADFDLEKLAGISGAQVHLGFARYYGHSVAATDIGTYEKIQGYWYPQRQWELAQLSWEQQFKEQHLTLLVGRINATWQFNHSTYGCRFVNASDCPYQLTNTTGGFSGFPYVNWGGRIKYQPDARYVSFGAFEINPGRRLNNGVDFSTSAATGVMIPLETGYETSFVNDAYPRHYMLGAWYDSADYTDPRLNTLGQLRALRGGTPRDYAGGRYGVYGKADQVVYRPDLASSVRHLALFGTFAWALDDADIYTLQATSGFVWNGLFAARPYDSLNFQATLFTFSKKQVGYENDLVRKLGSTQSFARNQLLMELNYSYHLMPWLFVVPNLQYIVHPDILGNPAGAHGVPANVLAVGIRLMLNMGGTGGG